MMCKICGKECGQGMFRTGYCSVLCKRESEEKEEQEQKQLKDYEKHKERFKQL